MKKTIYHRFGKRLFDCTLALLFLLLLGIPLALLAVLVRFKLGSPIFFRQERPGLHGQIFTLYKFRTMTDARDAHGALLPDADRLLPFGNLLRSSSLDELPELLNILKGEMSFVGPRPLLTRYLERYTPEQQRRHDVKPGLTGWAQVHGRNAITWEQKFAFDVWYVDNCSFALDVKIIFLTAWKILKREGISQPGHATMEEYMG